MTKKTRKKTNRRVYPKDNDDSLRDTIQKLKSQVRRLKKELKIKNEEVSSLRKARRKDVEQIENLLDNLTVEEVIHLTNKRKLDTKEEKREQIRRKFAEEYGSKKWSR